jgi:transcriptional regulator with XRE-family HTH domain
MATLGESLKRARKNINLTLRQVEDSLDISNAYLSQLENNKIKKPSADVLYKLSNLYRIDLSELLKASGIIEENSPAKTKKEIEKEELNQQVSYSLDELNFSQKKEVLNFMDFIKTKSD